jgi:dienelactone hydrolase
MKFPTWIKPALAGAGVGAVALAIVGFSWGGWTTSGSAQDLAKKSSTAAVAAALVPYCLELSKTSANSIDVMAELDAATTFGRKAIIEKAGWATPLGADKPNSDLAQACQLALAAAAA